MCDGDCQVALDVAGDQYVSGPSFGCQGETHTKHHVH
jgi:hypothetical protein